MVKDFITQLMQFNPEDRLTAKEALEHEWIQTRASNVEAADDKVT
jgi:serine/threonine protein kinase